jgi:hypothetical protein
MMGQTIQIRNIYFSFRFAIEPILKTKLAIHIPNE